jgi:hypothetical protein
MAAGILFDPTPPPYNRPPMKVALAQINPTVGDIPANARRIAAYVEQARSRGAQIVVFPELATTGYPPKDLLLKPSFIDDNLKALRMIAANVKGIDGCGTAPSPAGTSRRCCRRTTCSTSRATSSRVWRSTATNS